MLRIALPTVLLLAALPAHAAATVDPSLANPSDYSFAPPPSTALPPDPTPTPLPGSSTGVHGVVSSTVGNRGAGGSVAMEDTLPGGRTKVFLAGGGGEATPWKHGPTVNEKDVSVGVSTLLPGDSGSITMMFGTQQLNWGRR